MRSVGVRLVATLVAVIGAVNFLTAVEPRTDIAHLAAPIDGAAPGRAQMCVLGLVLLTLARGLVRARWAAYFGALVALAFATLIALGQHRPYAVIMAGTALCVLVVLRAEFRTPPDPVRLRLAGQIGVVAISTAAVGGAWDAYANRRAGVHGAGRLLLADLGTGSPESWRAALLTFALGLAVVSAIVVALAASPAPEPGEDAERAAVAALARHGDPDSLAPFATRADKAYVFSPDRRAAIGYRVLFGTALAGGDPVGAAEAAPDAMREFLAVCERHGWRPAVLGAGEAATAHWRALGLTGLHVGDEAVIPVARFSLASRRMRNLRQAVNRSRNAGVTVTIGPLTDADAGGLAPILAHWLHGAKERGFAMNLDAILTPRPDTLVAVAHHAGRPVAFARFAVAGRGRVYTLDVAPRGPHAPNGVAERMIAEIVDYAREHGGQEVSLNFAAMRWLIDAPGAAGRAGAAALHVLDRWVKIEPLNRFCMKFDPHWRTRRLMLRTWWEIAWVLAAALRAELAPAPVPPAGGPEPTYTDEPAPAPR